MLHAQIRGIVVDADNRAPLPDTRLFANGKTVITDSLGQFQLSDSGNDTIIVIKNGYVSLVTVLSANGSPYTLALEPSAYEVHQVVLTAFSTSGKSLIEQAGSISVIGKAEWNRDNPVTISTSLNRVPGLFYQQATFNTARLSIRGIGARTPFGTSRVRAYLEEIPLTNGAGETTLEDLDLSILDRAEIFRGPASSLYGAGLGGVIRLSAARTPYAKSFAEAGFTTGSYGLNRLVVRAGSSDADRNFQVNFNGLHSDGFRQNNLTDRWSLNVLHQTTAGTRSTVTVFANFIHLRAFVPSSLDSATYTDHPENAAANWLNARGYEAYDKGLFGVSWRRKLASQWNITSSSFFGFRQADEVRPFNILEETSLNLGGRAILDGKFSLGNQTLELRTGGEIFQEWYLWRTYQIINRRPGNALSDNQELRQYYNVFAQMSWKPLPKWDFTAGVNFNQTRYQLRDYFATDSIDQTGQYGFPTLLSPRVAFVYLLNKNQSIHGSVSQGFSPPDVSETLTPSGQINPDIRPETGWNYELGTRGQASQGKITWDVVAFYLDVRNLLVARRVDADQYIGVNAGRTSHSGIEFTGRWAFLSSDKVQLSAFGGGNIGRYRFVEFVDGDNNYSGNKLTGFPASTGHAGIDGDSRIGIYGNVNLQMASGYPMNDPNTAFAKGYQVLNTRLGWRRTWFSTVKADLFLGGNNLLDVRYAALVQVNALPAGPRPPRFYYPGLPRNFYAGIVLRWEKQR